MLDAAILAYPCVPIGVTILKRGVCLSTPTLMKVIKALGQAQDLENTILCTSFKHAMSRRQNKFVNCLSLKDVSIIIPGFIKRLVPAT